MEVGIKCLLWLPMIGALVFGEEPVLLEKISTPRQSVSVRSLSNFSSQILNPKRVKPAVYVVFQNKCVACRQQVRDLGCLQGNASVKVIGAFSAEESLRREYKKMNTEIPGFYGDQEFLKKFKITDPLTPQLLVFGKRSSYKALGLTSCKRILKLLM